VALNVPLTGLETTCLEPRLVSSGAMLVVLDVSGRVVGRYNSGGGVVREVCSNVNKH
jgi:hypothetical protein